MNFEDQDYADKSDDINSFIMERVWVERLLDISDGDYSQWWVCIAGNKATKEYLKELAFIVSKKFNIKCEAKYYSATDTHCMVVDLEE